MYILLKMVVFHCYLSLPEGNNQYFMESKRCFLRGLFQEMWNKTWCSANNSRVDSPQFAGEYSWNLFQASKFKSKYVTPNKFWSKFLLLKKRNDVPPDDFATSCFSKIIASVGVIRFRRFFSGRSDFQVLLNPFRGCRVSSYLDLLWWCFFCGLSHGIHHHFSPRGSKYLPGAFSRHRRVAKSK